MATKGIERLVRDKGSETKLLSGVAHCLAAVGLVLGGSAVTSPSSKAVATGRSTAQITVLYDAFGNTSSMQKDWGYAALVEYGGRRILFDTGNKPDILALNAKAKGFVRYYWLDTGNGEGASFGVFKDKAGADESVALAAEFVRTKMAQLLRQKPEVIEGAIKAHD